MLQRGVRPFSSLLTQYLSHRDVLTANMTRFGAGFILDGNIREAKEELKSIQNLLEEIEKRKDEPKPKFDLLCGSCYKK
jgi:hypothetical protein